MILTTKLFILLSLSLLPSLLTATPKERWIESEHIISQNIEDFDCHSSSLIEVSPGTLCAVWKGGFGKGKSNIDMKHGVGIWLAFFKDGQWSQPEQIVQSPNSVCWTPVLCKHPDGKMVLYYRIGKDPRHTVSMFKSSFDGGLSWSKEDILPAGIIGPTKAKPLVDKEGNVICGSSVEAGASDDEFKATACWVEILSGQQWSKYGPIEIPGKRFGCIEPALFIDGSGILKMLCRDRSNRINAEGWIWIAESLDMGKTWSELKKTNLPNPDSGIEVLSLNSSDVLVIYNNSHKNRFPLSVALSKDHGNSWCPLFNIEEESGEFPSAIIDSQGYMHISYAWMPPGKSQRQIKHVMIDVSKMCLQST